MECEKVIQDGLVALPRGLEELDIGIANGRIAVLAEPNTLKSDCIIDVQHQLVLPGAIDIHVHFREPGFTNKEDFKHGTTAAACGGFTVICDMPNTKPPTISVQALYDKDSLIKPNAYVDYGLWVGGSRIGEFDAMYQAGAVGIKIYMVGGHTYSQDLYILTDETLYKVLQESAKLGWLVAVHVGNEELSALKLHALQKAGRKDARAFMEYIKDFSAIEGLHRVLVLAKETGARIHIAHISVFGLECIDVINYFRQKGVQVSTEIDPPCLTYDDLDRLGTFALPFVLTDDDQNKFWEAIESGQVDIFATDHAPHTKSEKEPGINDVWAAPNGYPAIETSLAIIFDAVLTGRLSLKQMVSAVSTTPARLLGLQNKGRISVGCDADFVFLDPNREWIVNETKLHSKAVWSPFHGKRFKGRVTATLLRGEFVAQEGELVSEIAKGQRVTPSSRVDTKFQINNVLNKQ